MFSAAPKHCTALLPSQAECHLRKGKQLFVIQVGLASPAQHAIQLLLLGWLAATDGSGCPLVVLLQLLLFLQLHPCKQQTQFLCSSSAWSSHHCRSHLALVIWDLVCYLALI